MRVGDMVTDDRSHMDKSNLFYNAWLRYGVILKMDNQKPDLVTVMWWKHGKSSVTVMGISKLEAVSESR